MRIGEWLASERPDLADQTARDMGTAAEAAVEGGSAALELYGADELDVVDKGVDDPVTAADHASNRAILRVLEARDPLTPVLSEESPRPEAETAKGRLWVVDPLDGTKEFLARNGEFSVMVGLAVGGRASLGCVYQPAVDRLYGGIAETLAFAVDRVTLARDAEPRTLRVGASSRADPIRFVRSRSHPSPRIQALIDRLDRIEPIRSGSVGIKCALIAQDTADLYVHPVPYLKEWDTCAPEAVLRGAGGRVTDCFGRPLDYGKPDPGQPAGIFAARPNVWTAVRDIVEEIVNSNIET